MSNFFESNQKEYLLWDLLGNIEQGRQNLGSKVPVFIYRLFEYSLKEELTKQFGSEQAAELFRNAGERAGKEFAKNMLDLTLPMPQFFEHLQRYVYRVHDRAPLCGRAGRNADRAPVQRRAVGRPAGPVGQRRRSGRHGAV